MNLFRKWLKGIGVIHRTPAGRRKTTRPLEYRPRLEQLEDRCLLAGNLPWPITPAGGQPLTLLSTYGQYYGTAGGLHFHEGIDVIAAGDTAVFAIEAGRVAAISAAAAAPSSSYIAITTGTHGWNYIHTVAGTNRATGARWAVGDNIRQGDQIGIVGSFAGLAGVTFPDHLHLDYTSNVLDPNYPVLRPIDNPLNHLTALNYTVNPTVNPDIHFRLAADDANGVTTAPNVDGTYGETPARNHHYFTTTDANGNKILGAQAPAQAADGTIVAPAVTNANIDIIADAYDQLATGGNHIGLRSVWFSITGNTWGDKTGDLNPYRFSGEFLAGQNYRAFRTSNTVRTVFEHDATSNSTDGGDFWFTVTNSPVATPPQINALDRPSYWASSVAAGNQWNVTAPAARAARNAAGAFRDDFYTVTVWAFDEQAHLGQANVKVLLDNWTRTITTTAVQYNTTQNVVVNTGVQYTANQQVPLYVLTSAPADGQALPGGDLKDTVTTDANGVLPTDNLGHLEAGNYWVVADYLRDGVYHNQLDAFTPVRVVANGVPTVTGITPNPGPKGGGNMVTITGTGFTGASGVAFGANAATHFTVVNDTTITATVPAGAVGAVDVRVTTPAGQSAVVAAGRYTYQNVPGINAINPRSGTPAGGTVVTITGTDFTGATTVRFGAVAATAFTVNSATQITATAPAQAAGSAVDITVTTPAGTSPTTAADRYTYVNAPTVTMLSPNRGLPAGGTVVTVTGTGFTNVTAVRFGTIAATTFTVNSATQITATAPAQAAGTVVDVRVITPSGTSPASVADHYTYGPGRPTVNGRAPASGTRFGGTTVTITGTNFLGATDVRFGANAATRFTVDDDGRITATSPPGVPGMVDIQVTTPAGTSAAVAADQFTYQGFPAVTFINPNGGLPVGGNMVVITGSNFVGVTGVRFGNVAAAAFVVNTPTQITATAPAEAVGSVVHITVTTPTGTSPTTPADRYTYANAPAVTAINPRQGLPAGGNTVTITGTNFINVTNVQFGAVAATNFTVVNATQITATAPTQAAGVVDIRVNAAAGTSPAVAADRYTYAPAPGITAINPNQGPTTGGTAVRITGTDFTNVTAVKFGAVAATNFAVDSATQITATAPAHAAGAVDIMVTTLSGTSAAVAADRFTFVAPPGIIGLNPNHGAAGGGTRVVITGTNFTGATFVTFGSARATSFSVNSDGMITAVAPAHAPGVVDITVTTPFGSSTHNANDRFTFDASISTSTLVTSSHNPSVYGQAVTFTAMVSAVTPGSGTPTGTAQFQVDGVNFGTAVTLTAGHATSGSLSILSAGMHTITARYSGGGIFIASTGTLTQAVNRAPLAISANNQSKVYGATLPPLTASYSGFVNGDTAASLTTAPTLTTTATAGSPVGSYAITASGAVGANYTISYVAGSLSVTPAALTITANNQSKVYGAVLPPLTVSYSGFVNGDTAASLTTAATLTTTATLSSPVGSYPITASGAVDPNYAISYVAGALSVTPAATSIGLNVTPNPIVYGQLLTFNFSFEVIPPGSGSPTGTITVRDTFQGATTVLFTEAVGATGPLVFPPLQVGTHVLAVTYNGDSNFLSSTSTPDTLVVNKASTTTTLTSSSPTVAFGQPLTLSVNVAVAAPGGGTPTGTITIEDTFNGITTVLTSGTLGTTLPSFPPLAVGTHILKVIYSGDSNFLGSMSTPLTEVVTL